MVKEAGSRGDVAKNTILVLLVLTIVLSAISTWIVLDALNNVKDGYLYAVNNQPGITEGQINLGIMPNPDLATESSPPKTEKGAEVTISILKP